MKKLLKDNWTFILVVIIILLVRSFVITPIKVNGPSMNDTLLNGDIMILKRMDKIERNKIVVVSKRAYGTTLIKRVIALPGETIKCEDNNIYINGVLYEDKYSYGITNDFDEFILKDNEYFVMGDNREISQDSRYIGPINKKYIMGTTDLILFPLKRSGKVE